MQIRNRKASRRVKLSMNKFVSFSAEGKFSVEINTERLHTVPAHRTKFQESVNGNVTETFETDPEHNG